MSPGTVPSPTSSSAHARTWLLALALLVLALGLRLRGLDRQILGGDELHVLRVVAESPASEIVGLVDERDFSIPLALLYRAWSSLAPLSERALRSPMLVCGALLPLLGFFVARRLVGRRPAFVAALVLAAHPLAIFYGRFVRPYGIAACLVLGAVGCLETWWRSRRLRPALVGALLLALATWFHLASGLAAAWILVAYALRGFVERRADARTLARGVLALGAVAAGVALVLYAPAVPALVSRISEQYTGEGRVTRAVLSRNFHVLVGVPSFALVGAPFGFVVAVVPLLVGWGALRIWRRDRGIALLVLLPALGQLVSILVLSPRLIEFSFVLARYQFVVLALWVLLAALGLCDLVERVGRIVRLRPDLVVPPVGALVVAAWFSIGPHGLLDVTRSSFAHHNAFQTFEYLYDVHWFYARKGLPDRIPEIYRPLRGSGVPLLLEGPAPEAFYDNPLAYYQEHHRLPVKLVAAPGTFWASERFAFRNVLVADRLGEAELPVGTVAFLHPRGEDEVAASLGHVASPAAAEVYAPGRVAAIEAGLRARFGPPKVETPFVVRFDDAPVAPDPEPVAGFRPNIVLVLADDLGRGDVSWLEGEHPTPRIDRLMRDGLTLERFYAQPSCTSTRAGLLTGRHPIRFGMQRDVVRPWESYGLPEEEVTLPELLARAGYEHRALLGKWHLGHARRAHHPLAHGFTEFYGHYNGWVGYFDHARERTASGDPARDWHRGFESAPEDDGAYATELVADEAVRFISSHAADDAPFFLQLSFLAPHAPLEAPERYVAAFAELPEPRRTFLAKVACLDDAIGRVMDALDETGIAEETLVVFLSDNGGDPELGASNGTLRGGKHSVFEGGLRVAAAVRWPGHVAGGRRSSATAAYVDVLPTLARVAGVAAPPQVDGVDLTPLLLEGAEPAPRSLPFLVEHGGDEHLALVADEWKLVRRGLPLVVGGGDARRTARELALFRIREDPTEERDVAALHPNVVDRLLDELAAFRALAAPVGLTAPADPPPGWSAPVDWRIPAD